MQLGLDSLRECALVARVQEPASKCVGSRSPALSIEICCKIPVKRARTWPRPRGHSKARRVMSNGRPMGSRQPRTAGVARQQVATLCAPKYEILVPFSSTDSDTRKRSVENLFCLEHIPRRSRFRDRKTVAVLLPFCGTIFYNISQTSFYNCAPTRAGLSPTHRAVVRGWRRRSHRKLLCSRIARWSIILWSRRHPSRVSHVPRFSTQSRHESSSNDAFWKTDM